MSSTASIAANLACVLYLGRLAESDRSEIDEAIQVLLDALGGQSLRFEAAPGRLAINGQWVPQEVPGAGLVIERMLSHQVGSVSLPAGVEASDILALARTLAGYPGSYASWQDLQAALGPTRARLTLTEGLSDREFIHEDSKSIGVQLEEGRAGLEIGDHAAVEDGGLIPPPLPMDLAKIPLALRPKTGPREDPRILERLLARGRSALDAGDWGALLSITSGFLEAERQAVDESSARLYRVELKRLLSRREIAHIARLAAVGERRQEAVEVLQRLGGAATEVLMELLAESEALTERRGYYSAVTRMADGNEVIIHHLASPHWYVVRNAADLCGEMALAQAIPKLISLIGHPDERVRKSVLGALIQIGGREVVEPISRSFRDPSASVRLTVLAKLEGDWARGLAMPLMNLLQTEEHPDVIREILNALGRIGSPDAVMALRRVASGDMKRLGKRHRIQAVEAMGLAGGAAHQLLAALAQDRDREIAATAGRALGTAA
ncbi:MAG: HEAT repeat domain-containing protein [Gemmatimonadota bacterium]